MKVMKEMLLIIGATLASLSLSFAQAPQKMLQKRNDVPLRAGINLPKGLTYANRTNATANNIDGIGTGVENTYIVGAIELPQAVGVSIKGISYYSFSNDKYGKIFIASRKASSPLGEYTIVQVANTETAINGITTSSFPSTVKMEADKIYIIGYEIKEVEGGYQSLGYVDDTRNLPEANMIAFNTEGSFLGGVGSSITLENTSQENFGNLAIVLHYDDPQGRYDNLAAFDKGEVAPTYRIGNTIPASERRISVPIRNMGDKAITKVKLSKKGDSGDAEEKEITTNIAPFSTALVDYELGEITPPAKGIFTFTLKEVNGKAPVLTIPSMVNTKAGYVFYKEGQAVMRNATLIERFTTEKCSNCPEADQRLEEASKIAKQKGLHVVVAAHHVGYETDFLTVKESEELLPFFSKETFAPAISISRIYDPSIIGESLSGDRGIYLFPYMPDNIVRMLERARDIPILATIFSITQNNTGDNLRSITVKGKLLDPEIKNSLYLSIYRTEDGVSAQNQAGAKGPFIHNNVIRQFVTPTFGEKVSVAENGDFSVTVENVEVSSDWNDEKMHFVIFLHRSIKNKNIATREIFAVESIGVNTMTGTREVAPELHPVAYALDGRILISGAFDSFLVYDIAGRLIAGTDNTVLPAGLYIVKTRLGNVDYISKVIVK